MKVIDYIKMYPNAYACACVERSHTTPNYVNYLNHCALATFINAGSWDKVEELINSSDYYKPLEGVVLVAADYMDDDNDDRWKAYDAYQSGEIV
ncbi:hypothetical protein [Aeromonas phage AS-yj]|uniref:Uncharacterized protein n=1 Tax=Aeromonas phage AS-yj TaxID=2026115 RepID=A0A291LFH5_9CAUD|nr:hypothetical protein [Aeromonas phage AS-yj]